MRNSAIVAYLSRLGSHIECAPLSAESRRKATRKEESRRIGDTANESYLRSSKVFPMPGYTKVQAEIRATDNFGLVRTREVQMDISGDAARGTRKVIARRYEPECLRLAALARMNADQFCDNLTLTGKGVSLTLAFSSIDANKRYGFNLKRDVAHPNQWQALRPSTGTALSIDRIKQQYFRRLHAAGQQPQQPVSRHQRGIENSLFHASGIQCATPYWVP